MHLWDQIEVSVQSISLRHQFQLSVCGISLAEKASDNSSDKAQFVARNLQLGRCTGSGALLSIRPICSASEVHHPAAALSTSRPQTRFSSEIHVRLTQKAGCDWSKLSSVHKFACGRSQLQVTDKVAAPSSNWCKYPSVQHKSGQAAKS